MSYNFQQFVGKTYEEIKDWLDELNLDSREDQRLVHNTLLCMQYFSLITDSDKEYFRMIHECKDWLLLCNEKPKHGLYVSFIHSTPTSLSPMYSRFEQGKFIETVPYPLDSLKQN
jgi:hypothetical protein